MLHKIILTTFGVLTLATCQSQKISQPDVQSNTTVSPTKSNLPKTKTGEPEMSVGLPPDEEAKRIAMEEQSNATNISGITYLKEGQTIYLKENKMTVTFKNMKEDSRCPQDVNCIWAGVATAEIELMGESKKPLTILLSTMDNPQKGQHKIVNFQEYNYSLVRVSPETTSDKGFKALKGQYKIGLKIEKGTSENTIMQR